MASLTETAYYARRSIIFGVVGFILLLVGRAGFLSFAAWWQETHPPPPPPPTVAFGVLPAPSFLPDVDRQSLSWRLETIDGTTPNLGTQAKVFFMSSFRANVLGLELATSLAARLGFLFPPVPDASGVEQRYSWAREGALPGKLVLDLVTGHFTLTTSWKENADIVNASSPSALEAENIAKEYLRRVGILEKDVDQGKFTVEFLALIGGVLTPVLSQSEARFARVQLFRANIEKSSVVTSFAKEALVSVLVSGARSEKQVLEVRYQYSPVELERFATYPLRPSLTAWGELQSGNGVIVQLVDATTVVIVRSVELAYYDSDSPQEFLQPVYVFRGDQGFTAYVPAVDPKWLKEEE